MDDEILTGCFENTIVTNLAKEMKPRRGQQLIIPNAYIEVLGVPKSTPTSAILPAVSSASVTQLLFWGFTVACVVKIDHSFCLRFSEQATGMLILSRRDVAK